MAKRNFFLTNSFLSASSRDRDQVIFLANFYQFIERCQIFSTCVFHHILYNDSIYSPINKRYIQMQCLITGGLVCTNCINKARENSRNYYRHRGILSKGEYTLKWNKKHPRIHARANTYTQTHIETFIKKFL